MFERMQWKSHGLNDFMTLPHQKMVCLLQKEKGPKPTPKPSPYCLFSPPWEGQGEPWYPVLSVCRDLGLLRAFTGFQAIMALEAQTSIGFLPADDYTSSAGPISEAAGELSASPGLSVMLWSATRRPPD